MVRKIGLALALMTMAGVASASGGNSGNSETCIQLVSWLPAICIPTRSSGPSQVQAPEIDPASAIAGLTMLAAGMAVLRGRRRIMSK